MSKQLDLFDDELDWEEALTHYCEKKIEEAMHKPMYYAIYAYPDSERIDSIGPFETNQAAEKAMEEYDGEMVLKGTYGEIQVFLKHNNKTVVH